MSGERARPAPRDDGELLRSVDRRLRNLERATAARAGRWVLSTSESGGLMASHADGGSVLLSSEPPASASPDELLTDTVPRLELVAPDTTSIPTGTVQPIEFATVQARQGAWRFDKGINQSSGISQFQVPVPGWYLMVLKVQYGFGSGVRSSSVEIDRRRVYTDEAAHGAGCFPTSYIPVLRWLTPDRRVRATVWSSEQTDYGTYVGGASPTMLTVVGLRGTEV